MHSNVENFLKSPGEKYKIYVQIHCVEFERRIHYKGEKH